MLLVKTTVGQSAIHGLGLFAAEFIPAGTVVFTEESIFTRRILECEYENMPQLQKDFLDFYGYRVGGVIKVSLDNDRFANHSNDPNCLELDRWTTVAARDIEVGEEITANYCHFDDLPFSGSLGEF